jgi:hypothetical protein
MANSTKLGPKGKPNKPYPNFPLTAHATGRWCKKIRGKLHYFGRWGKKQGDTVVNVDNPAEAAQQAVDLFNEQRDDLYAGRTPRKKSDAVTLDELCNRFLDAKNELVETGELKRRS